MFEYTDIEIEEQMYMKGEILMEEVCKDKSVSQIEQEIMKLFSSRTFNLLHQKESYLFEKKFGDLVNILLCEYSGDMERWKKLCIR